MSLQLHKGVCISACVPRHQHLRNHAAMLATDACSHRVKIQSFIAHSCRSPQLQQELHQELSPVVTGTCALLAAAGLLAATVPAQAAGLQQHVTSPEQYQAAALPSSSFNTVLQQQQQQLPKAPSLRYQQQQQQQVSYNTVQQLNPVAEVAKVGQGRGPHWLIHVMSIGVVNILGLWGVLKLLAWSRDNSMPVSVIKLHMGLRLDDGCKLQERLHFIRQMMTVEHGMFFTMEETIQACCRPPRGAQLAYADIQVSELGSKQQGYDLFKQYAAVEERNAQLEEADHVVHGVKPQGPHHRTPLERLMGVAETQDAEESQACVVVTLVMLARGHVTLPQQTIRDPATFRTTMKHLCGHLGAGQLLAVELLLTPDSENDFLSEAALMEDYPFMIDLKTGKPISGPRQLPGTPGGSAAAAGYAA